MLTRHDQADKQTLAAALAEAVAADLRAGITARGASALAVSGGSTPAKFFATLAAYEDIDWSKVTVTLVDERWVNDNSDRSNARLVQLNLLQGPAKKARFVPLYSGGEEPTLRLIVVTCKLQDSVPHPFDAVILGMGNDGHTASFFPGGDALEQVLSEAGPALAISAPGAGEPRVTLTLPYLLNTNSLYLHIEGDQKAKTLDEALRDGPVGDMPIRAVLRQTKKPVNIYWCP
jgi:6-phosphogluconolactonase